MIDIRRIFGNPYRDKNITDKRFANFLDVLIERLKANNENGRHDAMIALLTAARDALRAEMTREDVSRVERIGKTRSIDALLDLFEEDVHRYEGAVKSAFGKKSEPYLAFFPQGLDAYNEITRTDAPILLQRWQQLTRTYRNDLAPAIVTLFGTYYKRYNTLRTEQQQLQAQVDDANVTVSDLRLAAELAVLEATFHIGGLFPGQVDRCASYFNQSLLLPRKGADPAAAPTNLA